ncbi:MAG: DUF166 family protein [Candidatus Aerophobetes bacterium]|nr:DUF166 family protein [Candidatus Aerophobetes bacterium]
MNKKYQRKSVADRIWCLEFDSLEKLEEKIMHILAVIQGKYGQRIVHNIRLHGPKNWEIEEWNAPSRFPPIIDDPEEFLPQKLPQTDLLLCLGENTGAAELIPGLAKMSQAKAVIAPIDNRDYLPDGLKNQIKGDLEGSGVDYAFPLPFCSLTEKASGDEYIKEFARYFGRPRLAITFHEGRITQITLEREAPCGSTRFIAEKLIELKIEEAEKKAGLLHHYYPCLASRKMDRKFGDSLLHKSADIAKQAVREALVP